MTDMPLEGVVPDHVPEWLTKLTNGTNINPDTLRRHFAETQVVDADRFDTKLYQKLRNEYGDLKDLAISRFVDDPTFVDLIQDIYLGLYKPRPETHTKPEMRDTHLLNWETNQRANETRDWNELRTYTTLDKWAAGMATVEFGEKLAAMFDELKELHEQQQQVTDTHNQVAGIIDALESADKGDVEALLEQLEAALEASDAAAAAHSDTLTEHLGEIRRNVTSIVNDALSELRDVDNLFDSFSTNPGQLVRVDGKIRMELAARIRKSKNLQRLADLVGRSIRLAMGEQARKVVHAKDTVHSVTTGRDLEHLLPSELVYLEDPDLELLFYLKYANRELLQYELRGTEKVARGAIVCMIDTSGSMSGVKDIWSKATAITLRQIAAAQNRAFYAIVFSSAHDPLHEIEIPANAPPVKHYRGVTYPYGSDIEATLDLAEIFHNGGGTNFELPLTRGVEILKQQYDTDGADKGDLVFITDGHSAVSDTWRNWFLETKQEAGFRMYSVLIGTNSPLLDAISDQVNRVTDFAQHTNIRDIYATI